MSRYIPSKYDNEDVGFDYGPECECDAPTEEECSCPKLKAQQECSNCGWFTSPGRDCSNCGACDDDERNIAHVPSWRDEREDFHADGFS